MNETNNNSVDGSVASISEDEILDELQELEERTPPVGTRMLSPKEMKNNKAEEEEDIFLYKQNRINYFKKFYLKQCIYSLNSYKSWIFLGCMDDTCYMYDSFLDDLLYYLKMSNKKRKLSLSVDKTNEMNNVIKLKTLKNEKYTDTILGVKFSLNYKYVGIGVYDGSVHVYKNNDFSGGMMLDYKLEGTKKNLNESNSFIKVCNWNPEFLQNKQESTKQYFGSNPTKTSIHAKKNIISHFRNSPSLNEEMSLISILDIKDVEGVFDLQDFMFCPYSETIVLSIYEKKQNVYIWDVVQNAITNIIYTNAFPTFLNVCNYGNDKHLIVGFCGGDTAVYTYDAFGIKLQQQNERKWKKNKEETQSRFYVKNKSQISDIKREVDTHELSSKCLDEGMDLKGKSLGSTGSVGSVGSVESEERQKDEPASTDVLLCDSYKTGKTSSHDGDDNNNNNNTNKKSNHNKNNNVNNSFGNIKNGSDERMVDGVLCIDNSLSNPIYVSTHNTTITLRTLNGNSVTDTLNIHDELVEYCLFNNKCANIIASCSLDNVINMYDIDHHSVINRFNVAYDFGKDDTFTEMETGINYLKWVNSNILLFASLNGNLYFYDIRERKCVTQINSHTGTIYNVDLGMHVFKEKYILSVLTSGIDGSANMHFLNMTGML